jgi:anti-sigma factor ChrR (cupin superfamily)
LTVHHILDEAARDQAALHALGALPADEARSYAEHLVACRLCRSEVDSLSVVVTELSLAQRGVAPAPALKTRLFERIRAPRPTEGRVGGESTETSKTQPWKSWPAGAAPGGFAFVPSQSADWEKTDIEGIETRRLFADPANDRVTMLVRMAPGTSYPGHVHGGPEDCYVLEGDLRVGELTMRKGDFQRAEKGSRHVRQSTEGGCVLLLVSSMQDRLIES